MVNFEMKDLQALPKGIFGTMDGGASCMVLGHDTLMNYIEHFHKEIDVSCFKFRPATKAMQFGGDRTMEAQWTVHMLVSGSTPLLIGRPILKAMKIQLNFLEDTMSVDGSPWKKIVMGPRGEHLLQLDEGLESIPENGSYEFDFMMEETFHAVTLLSTTWSSRVSLPQTWRRNKPCTHRKTNRTTQTATRPLTQRTTMMTPTPATGAR